jgi:hypothetical protein
MFSKTKTAVFLSGQYAFFFFFPSLFSLFFPLFLPSSFYLSSFPFFVLIALARSSTTMLTSIDEKEHSCFVSEGKFLVSYH